jgi:hypothetical protein
MPLVQPNFGYFTYESDDGFSYNIRASAEWAAISAHGLAARSSAQGRYITSGSRKPRMVTYKDLTTGRSKKGPVGTAAAYTALAIGDIHAFAVPDQTADVDYTLVSKTPEHVPGSVIQSAVADHA